MSWIVNNRRGTRRTFVAVFAAVSLASLLATGLGLGWFVTAQTEKAVIAHAVTHAKFITQTEFEGKFSASDFGAGLTPEQIRLLDETLHDHHPYSEIPEIKIWSKNGTIVYSTES
ncbi:MAG: hypothetical protein ACE5E0_03410, partial [Terriglobia bacterium]